MSRELRSAPEAERKMYLTVKTFTLRIFFLFIASFLSRANFSLPHISRIIGIYPSPDSPPEELRAATGIREAFSTSAWDGLTGEEALSNTETNLAHVEESPFCLKLFRVSIPVCHYLLSPLDL